MRSSAFGTVLLLSLFLQLLTISFCESFVAVVTISLLFLVLNLLRQSESCIQIRIHCSRFDQIGSDAQPGQTMLHGSCGRCAGALFLVASFTSLVFPVALGVSGYVGCMCSDEIWMVLATLLVLSFAVLPPTVIPLFIARADNQAATAT